MQFVDIFWPTLNMGGVAVPGLKEELRTALDYFDCLIEFGKTNVIFTQKVQSLYVVTFKSCNYS
jgi:hypothetical protein